MIVSLGRGMSPIKNALENTDGSLGGLIAGWIFDLDVTQAASYPGTGQTWFNLVPSPADGSVTSAYDFQLGSGSGSDTADPSFNGSAGSASAYFSNDGGDRFGLASQANTPFLESLHKTSSGQAFTMACAFQTADQLATCILMGTTTNTTGRGVRISLTSTEGCSLAQNDGTTSNALGTATTVSIGAPSLAILSWNGTNTVRAWINSRTKKEETDTMLAAGEGASSFMVLFRALAAGSRFYSASAFNTFFSDDDAAKLFDIYNIRHGRTYA